MPIQERYAQNNEILTKAGVVLNPENRGFRYGDGLFETILVAKGRAVALEMHLDRMLEGMAVLGLGTESTGFSPTDWREHVSKVVGKLLKGQDESAFGRIRITVYRQAGGTYLPSQDAPEMLAEIHPIETDPWTLRPPLHLGIAHAYPLVQSPLSAVKSLNALPYVMAARHAAAQGFDDAMLRSVRGEVAECTASNIFIVVEDRLLTPWLGSGCLPGTMRSRVIRAAQAIGITVQATPVQIGKLNEAREIFITNAIQGLQPVGSVAETSYSNRQHPMMSKIRDRILKEVG